jgi:lysine 6-dehydrogenase
MGYRYAIIGSGRQGTASAYDLARFGEADLVLMADVDGTAADAASQRINTLIGRPVARSTALDAGNAPAVAEWLRKNEIAAFVSAVPYFFNLGLTEAAIAAGCGMTDLGGNSDVVIAQLERDPQARQAEVGIVPDCGQVPGMGTTLILYAMEQLDEAQDVYMWDCGLPQHPEPPWNYRLAFSIEGLTNEYYGDCLFIRQGKTVGVPALSEYEVLDFPEPLGKLEGFTTAGGLTTAARTFAGRLRTLQNKTLRYPGNYQQLAVLRDLGLLNPDPIEVDGVRISPRQLLHALWDPQIRADPDTRDLILIHILARGQKNGRTHEVIVQLLHYYDEETGFTAMEQATGWHASIMTHAIARGEVRPGVVPVEDAMAGSAFVAQAAKRGFNVTIEQPAHTG